MKVEPVRLYGDGKSDELFYKFINNEKFREISKQKLLKDILY